LSIPPGDILLHGGDILFQNRGVECQTVKQLHQFNQFLSTLPHPLKFVIGGNHDKVLQLFGLTKTRQIFSSATYLCNSLATIGRPSSMSNQIELLDVIDIFPDTTNSSTVTTTSSSRDRRTRSNSTEEFKTGLLSSTAGYSQQRIAATTLSSTITEKISIWGSPYMTISGSDNDAFQCSDKQLQYFLQNLPNLKMDIALTHFQHPWYYWPGRSPSLLPRVHVFGHIHNDYGVTQNKKNNILQINASSLDGRYCPIHLPIVFDIRPVL